jgi:hypothetical protein
MGVGGKAVGQVGFAEQVGGGAVDLLANTLPYNGFGSAHEEPIKRRSVKLVQRNGTVS